MLRPTLKGADIARACACLAVFVHHLAYATRKPDLPKFIYKPLGWAIQEGKFGVSVFFVLSGFLLALPFWKDVDASRRFDLRYYAIMRGSRIVPATWVCLIASLAVETLYLGRYNDFTIVRFLAGFAFVSDWHWLTIIPIDANGPLLSLSFEISSYALMPLAFLACRFVSPQLLQGWKGRYIWAGVIMAALLLHAVGYAFLPSTDPATATRYGAAEVVASWFPTRNAFGFFAIFAIGILAAGVHTALPAKAGWFAVGRAILVLSAGVLVPYALFKIAAGPLGVPRPPFAYPYLPLALAIFLVGAQYVDVGRLIDNKIVAKFAQISFGIYIWHQLVLIFVADLVDMAHLSSAWRFVAIAIVSFVTTVIIADLSFRYFEEPILERARRWARR